MSQPRPNDPPPPRESAPPPERIHDADDDLDAQDRTDADSFPASDPPARGGITGPTDREGRA